MKPNYVELKESDTIVKVDVEEIAGQVNFCTIKELYLTPLEAILLSVIRRYSGSDDNGLKFVNLSEDKLMDIFRVSRYEDIEDALDGLIGKRLIVEGQDMSLMPFDNDIHRLFHALKI